jgi:hypothetical protein
MEDKLFFNVQQLLFDLAPGLALAIGKLEPVTEGWVVKIKDATDFEGRDGMSKAIDIALETTGTIAGSRDGELEIWDVVEIFESEAAATLAGKLNGQMYIYQIETGKFKWID